MAKQIPNLWRAHEDAVRLYQVYLVRLQMNGFHEKVIAAARQIRRYAVRGPGAAEGVRSASFSRSTLCAS